ncbi:uncharacterized protein PHA67_009094 isoform 1-T2 [Liasis olivaceus]
MKRYCHFYITWLQLQDISCSSTFPVCALNVKPQCLDFPISKQNSEGNCKLKKQQEEVLNSRPHKSVFGGESWVSLVGNGVTDAYMEILSCPHFRAVIKKRSWSRASSL